MTKAKFNKKTKRWNAAPRHDLKKYKGKSEAQKKKWQNPEWREKMLKVLKEVGERRRGKITSFRTGVPSGMRRAEAEVEWYFARMYAKEVIRIMKAEGILSPNEDEKAEQALTAAIEVLQSPMSQSVKLQAARLILDFTKAKPAAKSEITVQKAEDWLAAVTQDHIAKTEGK